MKYNILSIEAHLIFKHFIIMNSSTICASIYIRRCLFLQTVFQYIAYQLKYIKLASRFITLSLTKKCVTPSQLFASGTVATHVEDFDFISISRLI